MLHNVRHLLDFMAGFHKKWDNHYYFKEKTKMGNDSSTSWSSLRAAVIETHISQGLLETIKLKKKKKIRGTTQ